MDLFGSQFRNPSPTPTPTPAPASAASTPVISVGQLVRRARMLLEGQFASIWVKGEISNLKRQASGHIYFTLKDGDAQLSCAMFRGNAQNVVGRLADGVEMEAFGELTIFEARGAFQMNVKRLRASGQGALQAAFETLKAKLAGEGLFDPQRKKPLPSFPRTVALVTSPTGAALQDMLNILQRRAPWIRVLLFPVQVQGVGAAEEIANAVRYLSRPQLGLPVLDLLVVGRGGGSAEDLWSFNDEGLARAISASPWPVISAVGHEIDFTIADFVADLRAPTPSAAAEMLSPNGAEILARLAAAESALVSRAQRGLRQHESYLRLLEDGALHRVPQQYLAQVGQLLDNLAEDLPNCLTSRLTNEAAKQGQLASLLRAQRPEAVILQRGERLAVLGARLKNSIQQRLGRIGETLHHQARLLKSLGPESVLSRGYSLTTNAQGQPVSRAASLKPGDVLKTKFADGVVESVVQS